MRLSTSVLLFASVVCMAAPAIPTLRAYALPPTGIEQLPFEAPTTFPIHEPVSIEQLPQYKEPLQPIDTGTYIAPPRTVQVPSGGAPRPWRDSSGKFAGSNPFGSAPRNLY
ncbi:hypothetical protein [Leptolyngbya ohadii]|uniref:hypothetical protein n=1 Tax=Leptolyngbya ohadii TaxID=1962290 RepID=UPI00117A0D52|nr:hypothetical protein [Leptolyngbya ohadii]